MNIRYGFLFILLILTTSCGSNIKSGIGQNTDQPQTLLPTTASTLNHHSLSPSPVPDPQVNESNNQFQTCNLTGGEVVESGWSGKDTGVNYCNQCMCLSDGLACTKMGCQVKTITK